MAVIDIISSHVPSASTLLHARSSIDSGTSANEFRSQWQHPGDVFSVLLLLGGDVIGCALGQLSGGYFTPVTFSFGWVAYAVSALVSAVGENKLMPTADTTSIIINADSGYVRSNSSWILGRIIRDFDHWKDPAIHAKQKDLFRAKQAELTQQMLLQPPEDRKPVEKVKQVGLIISVYQASLSREPGVPTQDWVYWSGALVSIVQLGIAAIPCRNGDWGTIMVTAIGTVLALATGSLGQWAHEKWACRRDGKAFVMTRGNGSQHAILVLGRPHGLNLEDLATAQVTVDSDFGNSTRIPVAVLAILWVLLLITAAGEVQDTWFLLAVGGIGMLHNVSVAGWPRHPSAFGIHLDFEEVIADAKVMGALYKIEEAYPKVGISMLDTFFPGVLREHEEERWEGYRKTASERKKQKSALAAGRTGGGQP